ncbi:hypothetical protein Hanom_Chr09g00805811 [Helianthus anomalus]
MFLRIAKPVLISVLIAEATPRTISSGRATSGNFGADLKTFLKNRDQAKMDTGQNYQKMTKENCGRLLVDEAGSVRPQEKNS